MFKKIKIYFINRKIKKTIKEIEKLQKQLKWVHAHIHDFEVIETISYIKAINKQLKTYKYVLHEYKQHKETILK